MTFIEELKEEAHIHNWMVRKNDKTLEEAHADINRLITTVALRTLEEVEKTLTTPTHHPGTGISTDAITFICIKHYIKGLKDAISKE